ncbi:MAG: hypothetical protein HKP48_04085 [Winogradskyella sp.]|uniref:hypothetical protein n=1 Tax=Winogradskyella sp. TaxID=1883156 RepID=UPI001801317C|nr:hypothetical protein [Winogradskyella sp.]MBT8243983.1 hypothetical protein [Winogradskyella sp.]NNK22480.1 hypothetical protein [Winogradskyella sp.]
MKVFTIVASIIAIALIIFSATKLNFDNIMKGESATGLITIAAALCVILLLQVFRVSKKVEKLYKKRK